MTIWRDPHPKKLDTELERMAFRFAVEYVLVSRRYGRPAPLDMRVQRERNKYLLQVDGVTSQ